MGRPHNTSTYADAVTVQLGLIAAALRVMNRLAREARALPDLVRQALAEAHLDCAPEAS
jgi:hypothetical protein